VPPKTPNAFLLVNVSPVQIMEVYINNNGYVAKLQSRQRYVCIYKPLVLPRQTTYPAMLPLIVQKPYNKTIIVGSIKSGNTGQLGFS